MRINPFKQLDAIISRGYKIPIFKESRISLTDDSPQSFMEVEDKSIDLGTLMEFVRKYVWELEGIRRKCEDYEAVISEYKFTEPRTEYKEGCRDTFGAGFTLEYDDYKDIREVYWKHHPEEAAKLKRIEELEAEARKLKKEVGQ